MARRIRPSTLGRGGKHTATGLAEKHIDLAKLSMLKLKADLQEEGTTGSFFSFSDIAGAVMMAQTRILSYGGVTPCMAVLGTDPRELYELDNTSVEARQISFPEVAYLERSTRRRMLAKGAILRAVADSRIVQANATRPQIVEQELK